MSSRIVAALATGALVVGIVVGVAAAVLVGNATVLDRTGMNGSMDRMMTMMGGSMMGADFDDMADMHGRHHGSDR